MTELLTLFDSFHPILRFTLMAAGVAGWLLLIVMIIMQRRIPRAEPDHAPGSSSEATELLAVDWTVPMLPADQEKLRVELHLAKTQSERDHWQLSRALPAFERVTKQNEELRRHLAAAEERIRLAEEHIARLEKAISARKKMTETA